jgi:hypothetical protein
LTTILPKHELYRRMERFAADENRVISWKFLGELAGLNPLHLRNVFVNKTDPLTELVQMRVSKALERIANGDVTVVRWRDGKRELRFNNEPKPRMMRAGKLVMRDGKVQLDMRLQNRGDYSAPTLQEQMGRK